MKIVIIKEELRLEKFINKTCDDSSIVLYVSSVTVHQDSYVYAVAMYNVNALILQALNNSICTHISNT